MRSNTTNLTEAFNLTADVIDPIYRFIVGSLTGKTWQTNSQFAFGKVVDAAGINAEKAFDSFADSIKGMFKEGGIFNKIGKGIGGMIMAVHRWLTTMINKLPGAGNEIPGFGGLNYGQTIACGLLSALVLIAFYKVFKGLLGSDKDEDDRYERYIEAIDAGNKIVVDFYNLTEHMVYQQKYKMLSEGIFGGIFEFIGKTIRKAFKFVGDIIKDVYRGAKKHPMFALFVLVLCFFVCFCMAGPVSQNISSLAYGTPKETPGIIASMTNSVKGAFNAHIGTPIAKVADKIATIKKAPWEYAKSFFSEDADLDVYVNTVFDKI